MVVLVLLLVVVGCSSPTGPTRVDMNHKKLMALKDLPTGIQVEHTIQFADGQYRWELGTRSFDNKSQTLVRELRAWEKGVYKVGASRDMEFQIEFRVTASSNPLDIGKPYILNVYHNPMLESYVFYGMVWIPV